MAGEASASAPWSAVAATPQTLPAATSTAPESPHAEASADQCPPASSGAQAAREQASNATHPPSPCDRLATKSRVILCLTFHTLENGDPYWDESASYQFTAAEIDTSKAAGNTLQEMCLNAAQHIIDNKRYVELPTSPPKLSAAIEWAWNNESPATYGRFDLSWAGVESGNNVRNSLNTTPPLQPASSKPPVI